MAAQASGGRSIDTFTHASTLGAQVAQAAPEGEPLLPPARRSSLQARPPAQAKAEDEPGMQQPAASVVAEEEDTRTGGGCESGSLTGGGPAAGERSPARLERLGSSPRVSVTPPQALHNQLAELRRMQVGVGERGRARVSHGRWVVGAVGACAERGNRQHVRAASLVDSRSDGCCLSVRARCGSKPATTSFPQPLSPRSLPCSHPH